MFSISKSLSFVLLSGLILGALDAAELPAMTNRFVVIAHRGEHLRHQENTLEAIEGAIAAGADFVEMDLRRSRDGVHLLMHDRTVDRMTTGQGPVASLTWTELSALSVRDRRLTQVPPSRIPKFTEALRACHGRIRIYLDFKDGDRAETAKLIREAGCERDVVVYDDSHSFAEWRKVAPRFPLITSPPKNAATDAESFASFLQMYRPEVLDQADTKAEVMVAHRAGTKVWPDIQQAEESSDYWQPIVDRGVDGVQTDHPAELVAWLKAVGRR